MRLGQNLPIDPQIGKQQVFEIVLAGARIEQARDGFEQTCHGNPLCCELYVRLGFEFRDTGQSNRRLTNWVETKAGSAKIA
jgi:hypothetical protein